MSLQFESVLNAKHNAKAIEIYIEIRVREKEKCAPRNPQ